MLSTWLCLGFNNQQKRERHPKEWDRDGGWEWKRGDLEWECSAHAGMHQLLDFGAVDVAHHCELLFHCRFSNDDLISRPQMQRM